MPAPRSSGLDADRSHSTSSPRPSPRRRVIQRDGPTCRRCGIRPGAILDHKKELADWREGDPDPNRDENLQLLGCQVIATNTIFVLYAILGVHWKIPEFVMLGWLGSTVVELVGVAAIVTRSLFPRRDLQGD